MFSLCHLRSLYDESLILFLQKENFAGTSEEALSVQRSMQSVSTEIRKFQGVPLRAGTGFGGAEFSLMS